MSIETITDFATKHQATLTIMEGGEHWFHTEEQMRFLDRWIEEMASRTCQGCTYIDNRDYMERAIIIYGSQYGSTKRYAEAKTILATYGKKVDYVDFQTLDHLKLCP